LNQYHALLVTMLGDPLMVPFHSTSSVEAQKMDRERLFIRPAVAGAERA
jgi:hypothetical protein